MLLADSATNKQHAAVYQPRFQKLQEAYPTNAAIPFALGVLAHKSGDLETAKGSYERSLSLDASQSKVHLALASLLATQKNTNMADAQYEAAAALAPAKSWERLKQVEHLLNTRRYD